MQARPLREKSNRLAETGIRNWHLGTRSRAASFYLSYAFSRLLILLHFCSPSHVLLIRSPVSPSLCSLTFSLPCGLVRDRLLTGTSGKEKRTSKKCMQQEAVKICAGRSTTRSRVRITISSNRIMGEWIYPKLQRHK